MADYRERIKREVLAHAEHRVTWSVVPYSDGVRSSGFLDELVERGSLSRDDLQGILDDVHSMFVERGKDYRLHEAIDFARRAGLEYHGDVREDSIRSYKAEILTYAETGWLSFSGMALEAAGMPGVDPTTHQLESWVARLRKLGVSDAEVRAIGQEAMARYEGVLAKVLEEKPDFQVEGSALGLGLRRAKAYFQSL